MNLILEDDFRAIALQEGVREVCLADAFARFEARRFDGTVREFLKEVKPDAAHWFAAPAADSSDNELIYSIAAQGAYVREHGEEAARSLLAASGLKLGQTRKAPAKDYTKSNPYDPAKPGEEDKRTNAIIALVSTPAGNRAAIGLSRSAGCNIDGSPIRRRG